ncbi:N2227-like protein-domain-containing protein [Mucidula mucida]|nr:N2227-like protein-domain-containing protein [Mucidula mucida]
MQLLYYDRSIVAVSQPFQIVDLQTSSQCECLDERRFIVVLICLHRATLAQRGILENLMPDPFLDMYQNYTDDMAKDPPPASVLNVALLRKRDVGYDYIVTLFFIDALLNPVRTLAHIYSLLASGGVWINLGPLLYGTGGQERVELSLDEVLAVAESLGFEFDDMRQYGFQENDAQGKQRTTTVNCEYTCDDRAMMRWVYGAEMWVARKR